MFIRNFAAAAGTVVILSASAFAFTSPANALTMKECSAKYQALKDAGTLGNVKWNDFRKTQCAENGASPATPPAKSTQKPETTKKPDTAKKTDTKNTGAAGLTMKQCSAKYQAAKDAGQANGIKWQDFRKAECGPGADSVALSTDGAKEPPAPTKAAPKGVKFPTSVSPKFASETPGKARMRTCLEQYHALKDANALGGLKWIQKGGGYYSLCNAQLKGKS